MAELHPSDDLLLDLVMSDVDEHQRDRLTTHLARCEPCHARYAELSGSVDHVLAAAPRVEPPPGFSAAVLAAIGLAGAEQRAGAPAGASAPDPGARSAVGTGTVGAALPTAEPGSSGRGTGRRWRGRRPVDHRPDRRRGVLVAVVAAVLAFLVGAGGTAWVLRAQAGFGEQAQAAASGPALVTDAGQRVGTVLDSQYEGDPVLIVTITDGKVGMRYDCDLILADGTRQTAGSWVLRDASGATWILDTPGTPVTAVELVTEVGRTWATARL